MWGPVELEHHRGEPRNLRYWKDERDVPDVMLALLNYPKTDSHPDFTLALRVNFKSEWPTSGSGSASWERRRHEQKPGWGHDQHDAAGS